MSALAQDPAPPAGQLADDEAWGDPQHVPDDELAARLRGIYGSVEAFSDVRVRVQSGVVRLTGEVLTSDDREQAVAIARRLDGTVYVDDQLDSVREVSRQVSPALQALQERGRDLAARLPLMGLAAVVVLVFWGLSRAISSAGPLLGRLRERPLLQGIARQILRLVVVLVGVILALELLDLTALVGAVLGAAGVLGVILGFAFKDIAENYLASILLSVRQPFSKNDLVRIGDLEGKVVRLTLRETVLMTINGNHLRVPNAQVFKSTLVNFTLNPLRRFCFTVGVGVGEDLQHVAQLCRHALLATPGVTADPSPVVLVDAIGESNVTVQVAAWVDQRDHGFLSVRSEGIRRVKAALDDAGVDLPEPVYRVFTGELMDGLPAMSRKAAGEVPADAPTLEPQDTEAQVDAQIDEDRQHSAEGDLLES